MFDLLGLAVGGLICLGVLALLFKLFWALLGLVLLPVKLLAVGIAGIFLGCLALLFLPAVVIAVPLLALVAPLLLLLAPLLLIGLLIKASC